MSTPAIALSGVTKRFGLKTAVDDLSLEVAAGSLCRPRLLPPPR